jgi:hypothetical protein
LFATPAMAQKTINLTAIDGYPPKASWVREFIQYYIPAVNKTLAAKGNYKIQWNQACRARSPRRGMSWKAFRKVSAISVL